MPDRRNQPTPSGPITSLTPHLPTDPAGAGIWAALVFYTHRAYPQPVRTTTDRTLSHLLTHPTTTLHAGWGAAAAAAALLTTPTLLTAADRLAATQMERHLTREHTPLWLLTATLNDHATAIRIWHHFLHTTPTAPHPQPRHPAAGPAATPYKHPLTALHLTALHHLLHPPARNPAHTPPDPHTRAHTAYQQLRATLPPAHFPHIHHHQLPGTPPTHRPPPDAHPD